MDVWLLQDRLILARSFILMLLWCEIGESIRDSVNITSRTCELRFDSLKRVLRERCWLDSACQHWGPALNSVTAGLAVVQRERVEIHSADYLAHPAKRDILPTWALKLKQVSLLVTSSHQILHAVTHFIHSHFPPRAWGKIRRIVKVKTILSICLVRLFVQLEALELQYPHELQHHGQILQNQLQLSVFWSQT